MLQIIAAAFRNLLSASREKEIESMRKVLKGMSAEELVVLVGAVLDERSRLADAFGIECISPIQELVVLPKSIETIEGLLAAFRKRKMFTEANGMAVWAFTFRGAEDPHLRLAARELWRELGRGFPLARQALEANGLNPMMIDYPRGFEPL